MAIAHPQWSSLTIEDGRALPMAHAVEIYNHGCALECGRGDGAVLLDALLNEGRRSSPRSPPTTRISASTMRCGGWVMVKAEENEPDALLAALKAGRLLFEPGAR